jgi:hypothetical protein
MSLPSTRIIIITGKSLLKVLICGIRNHLRGSISSSGRSSGCIVHTVSLQTLINRKLLGRMRWLDLDVWNQSKDSQELIELPSTSKIREYIGNDIYATDYYYYGMAATVTALCFGYNAYSRCRG